jgi:ATP-dependent RNA helicase DDX56/DBP9
LFVVRTIISALPSSYQAILTSATLTADIETLKKLALHNPVTLKLEEAQLPDASQLTQYHICCEEEDRFVLLYALIKLRLIQGKTIIFVANTDRCYRYV